MRELSANELDQVSGGKPIEHNGIGWIVGGIVVKLANKVLTTIGPLLW
jgi:bacteriocin-like protein